MEKRYLGNTEIVVHPIGIGLWAMGGSGWGPTEDSESLSTIDRALDLGIDLFDTADVYGNGHSEELLGQAMKGRRDRFIAATKIGWQGFDGEKATSAYTSPEKVEQAVEANLRRLQSDHIDILQWHVNFRETTMEHFIEGCERLKKAGKIRAYGVSTSNFEYIQAFAQAGHQDSLQIDYSILNRTAEQEIFPYCQAQGIGTIIRGGLAMGILTGKFSADSTFDEDDFRGNWQKDPDQHKQFLADLQSVEKLRAAFPEQNLAQLALRFVLSNPAVTCVIAGAKRISQLESNFQAAQQGLLHPEELKTIEQIVPAGGGRKIWPA
jgi:aryl-alcohol dehydrogenase-like predicted oxidoreductase